MNIPQTSKLKMRKIISVLTALSGALGLSLTSTMSAWAQNIDYSQIITSEASWITSTQIPAGHGDASGAIPIHPDPSGGSWKVSPYDANIAAMGLLDNGTTDAAQVKSWMNWYIAHLNWPDYNGKVATIYDYSINATTYAVTPILQSGHPSYDSTDSYAATFLSLCHKYAAVTGDVTFLRTNEYQVNQIIGAMLSTKQSDNLTWARPDYPAKYLMDNTEVYTGLNDAAWLYQNVFTDDLNGFSYYSAVASDVKTAIQTYLWNSTLGMYVIAKNSDGTTDTPSWSSWPSATTQLWALKAGIVSNPSAMWNAFNSTWDNAVTSTNWTTTVNNPDTMPWGGAGYAAAVMGDKSKIDAFLAGANTNYINLQNNSHHWPWSVREAGFTMSAAAVGKNL
ncbi:MAG TPA: hypothetical protein VLG92_01790 [Candidatus Saccharimonadia bacterium]|nr:hypothetical protein [Candidatus Saccharimonadia bacterium]